MRKGNGGFGGGSSLQKDIKCPQKSSSPNFQLRITSPFRVSTNLCCENQARMKKAHGSRPEYNAAPARLPHRKSLALCHGRAMEYVRRTVCVFYYMDLTKVGGLAVPTAGSAVSVMIFGSLNLQRNSRAASHGVRQFKGHGRPFGGQANLREPADSDLRNYSSCVPVAITRDGPPFMRIRLL